MKRIIRKLFDIREGEYLKSFLMFSYIFLIIASLLIIKPVRNSLFLTRFGVGQLPYVFVLVAISAAIVVRIYSGYSKKVKLVSLILGTLVISVVSLFIFWLLLYFDYQGKWFLYTFYIWVAIFGVITTSQFWLLANLVFNAREARRLFGFLGAGAISGGIFGGYLTNYVAPILGTRTLIFFCIAFLLACIFILSIVWKTSVRQTHRMKISQEKKRREEAKSENSLKLILKSDHLRLIAAMVGISVIVASLVDYQFSAVATESIQSADKLTAFFGFWLSNLSIISLFIQLFLTRFVLKKFGVMTSLFFLPIGILLGAVALLVTPVLALAVFLKLCDGSLKQSINKAGMELLVLPIPAAIKNRTKAFVDVFVDSFAQGIGGILLIIFTYYLNFSVSQISLIIIFLVSFWLYMVVLAKGEYINSFRMALEKRTINLEEQTINLEDATVLDSLVKVLEGKNERQILYVLDLVETFKSERFIPYLRDLISHPSGEVKVRVLRILRSYEKEALILEASELIEDEDQEVQIEAMRYLYQQSLDRIGTLEKFLNYKDYRVQNAALICVAEEFREDHSVGNKLNLKELFKSKIEYFREIEDETKKDFLKESIARVIGIVNMPDLYPYLHILLNDDAPGVVKAAINSAGQTHAQEFVPVLVQHLDTKFIRKFAREALADYGESIIEHLQQYMNNQNERKNIRLAIPRVLSLIGAQRAANILVENLNLNDLLMRYETILALNRLKANFSNLRFDATLIEDKIYDETRNYYRILLFLDSQQKFLGRRPLDYVSEDFEKAKNLLIKALSEKLDENLERIFRLLGLRYTPKDMLNAYQGIRSEKVELRANALEFLDNVLDANLKKIILPIVESASLSALIDAAKDIIDEPIEDEMDCLNALLEDNDNWLKVCAIYLVAQLRDTDCVQNIGRFVSDPDPIVKETAEYALNQLM